MRDSPFIVQESDTVIMLWRESKRTNGEVIITDNVTVSVQANRCTGKMGNVKMVYPNGHFVQQTFERHDEPHPDRVLPQENKGVGRQERLL